jgi:hypothetical protein
MRKTVSSPVVVWKGPVEALRRRGQVLQRTSAVRIAAIPDVRKGDSGLRIGASEMMLVNRSTASRLK